MPAPAFTSPSQCAGFSHTTDLCITKIMTPSTGTGSAEARTQVKAAPLFPLGGGGGNSENLKMQ
jgi:hypothetical protein